MRMIVGLALAVAACGGAASQAEDQSVIADGRAIDGDTVSFDVSDFEVPMPSKSGNYAGAATVAGHAARRRRTMRRSC
jgi:hypothetical protein